MCVCVYTLYVLVIVYTCCVIKSVSITLVDFNLKCYSTFQLCVINLTNILRIMRKQSIIIYNKIV